MIVGRKPPIDAAKLAIIREWVRSVRALGTTKTLAYRLGVHVSRVNAAIVEISGGKRMYKRER